MSNIVRISVSCYSFTHAIIIENKSIDVLLIIIENIKSFSYSFCPIFLWQINTSEEDILFFLWNLIYVHFLIKSLRDHKSILVYYTLFSNI